MTDCKRSFTLEQILDSFKAGRTLYVDHKAAPELADLHELERQGLVQSKLVQLDEQSSVLKFWWVA